MSLVLGIDSSTTATKAIVVDREGRVVASASSSYDYETPRPMWTEQSPLLWWEGATASIRQVLAESGTRPEQVEAVGLTGQMHGSVLLDEEGEVVRPAILWNDQRTGAECDEIRRRVGRERLIEITGNDALTGFTAPKLLWVQTHEPDQWARVRHVLLPKDYVRFRLTGDHAVDVADGSGTILFDLEARTWSAEILDTLQVPEGLMPSTHEGPDITGKVGEEGAAATGLLGGTPVVAGGGDQAANAVGVGAVEPGIVALSLGTSGVVFATTEGPAIQPEGRVHAFCHAVPGRWHMMGVMLSAAGSLRWLRDALAPGRSFDELVEGASEAPPGSDGLLFLPYLTGERTPHPDPLARGAFVGLTVRHDLRHMTRAVMEGVAFGLRDGLDLMVDAGLAPPAQIRAAGGGIRSPLWRQILADVLDTEITLVGTEEGAAYGAALLASVGAGWAGTVDDAVGQWIEATAVASPGVDREAYATIHTRFRDLYPALAPTFHALGSG
jgi:xylulokinase